MLIGIAALNFVPKGAVGVADGVKGTFGYLVGDLFAKIGLGMMADHKLTLFGLTGWQGTFGAMYISVFLAILIMAYVAWGEENKIRQNQIRGIH